MKIEKIEVENFKCFKHIKLNLENLNIIIGKNASGKSNIINIIKFIKDMLVNGIDEAIDLQGGINYLYNSNIRTKEPIKVNFVMNTYDNDTFQRMSLLYMQEKRNIMLEKYEVTLVIQPNKQGAGYKILENSIKIFYVKLELNEKIKQKEERTVRNLQYYEKGETILQTCYEKNGEVYEEFSENTPKDIRDALKIQKHVLIARTIMTKNENLLLVNYIPALYYFQITGENNIKIYDFNPKDLKRASIINKKNILEEDGSNIANVIQRILKNSEEKKKLLLILKRLMPFIEDIHTEKSFNKSMYFKVKENSKIDLPSELLSDGTVNIIAIIVALYFEKDNDIVIIEEPEKNIHPKLVNQLVTLMKDVGYKKQIIITTHNTQLLSSVELNDIIYVYRNRNMYSDIERPNNNKKVKEFIKNDLEIGDLFYEGLFTEEET